MLLVCVNTEHIISKLIHFNTLFRFSWCWNIIAAYVSITIWTFKRLLSTFVLEVAKFIWTVFVHSEKEYFKLEYSYTIKI